MKAALKAGVATQRLAALPAWRETTLYSDAERAALALAESITTLPTTDIRNRDLAAAREVLGDDAVSAVCWVAVAINSFNRISIVSGHQIETDAQP